VVIVVERLPFTSRFYTLATFAFLLFIIYGSFVPWQFREVPFSEGVEIYRMAMSKPISYDSKSDFVANVMLFIPLGYLALGALSVDRKPPLVAGFLLPSYAILSAGIEFGQVWAAERFPSINDVVGETLGGLIGSVLWLVAGQPINARLRAAWSGMGPGDWALRLFPPYVILIILLQGMPFDLTISPYLLKEKWKEGRIALAPPLDADLLEKILRLVVYFWPAGVLAANLPSRSWRNSAPRVLALGVVLGAIVEAVQLIVLSCGTYGLDVLLAGLIVLVSWAKTHYLNLESPKVRFLLLLAWVGLLAWASWAPWDGSFTLWKERLKEVKWIPYADYYEGDYLRSFDRILQKIVLFIPVGFFVGRVRYGLLIGGLVGAMIELGQSVFTIRHPVSVSDICNGIVGGVMGSLLTRQFLTESRRGLQGFRYQEIGIIPEAIPIDEVTRSEGESVSPVREAVPVGTNPSPAAAKTSQSPPPSVTPIGFPPGASPYPPGASPYPTFIPPPSEE
jgi:glycopeptide antibiotics resistance protein